MRPPPLSPTALLREAVPETKVRDARVAGVLVCCAQCSVNALEKGRWQMAVEDNDTVLGNQLFCLIFNILPSLAPNEKQRQH